MPNGDEAAGTLGSTEIADEVTFFQRNESGNVEPVCRSYQDLRHQLEAYSLPSMRRSGCTQLGERRSLNAMKPSMDSGEPRLRCMPIRS